MAYDALARGMLTGKYVSLPAALDIPTNTNNHEEERIMVMELLKSPRDRMDTRGWGGPLYRYRSAAAQAAIRDYAKIANQYNNMPSCPVTKVGAALPQDGDLSPLVHDVATCHQWTS